MNSVFGFSAGAFSAEKDFSLSFFGLFSFSKMFFVLLANICSSTERLCR